MAPKHLIIDGYNVLGAMGLPPHRVVEQGEHRREEFIVRLGLYGNKLHHLITLVFDAWQQSGASRQVIHRNGVTVIYTGQGEKADGVIQDLIRSHGKGAAVVSSDLEVIAVAKAFGAFSIRSQEFVTRLASSVFQGEAVRRPQGGFSQKDSDEEPVRSKEKKGNPRRLPKKVRQRNRIMKKF
ncbi:MAG: NYN domain-containing protein [Nitrospiraceae bacterium]|nr:NYN domain-containing protein [Nitrospira sp.]MCB9775210.1 NYN domain-containing protein [Nitrospiraceae bacterium]